MYFLLKEFSLQIFVLLEISPKKISFVSLLGFLLLTTVWQVYLRLVYVCVLCMPVSWGRSASCCRGRGKSQVYSVQHYGWLGLPWWYDTLIACSMYSLTYLCDGALTGFETVLRGHITAYLSLTRLSLCSLNWVHWGSESESTVVSSISHTLKKLCIPSNT